MRSGRELSAQIVLYVTVAAAPAAVGALHLWGWGSVATVLFAFFVIYPESIWDKPHLPVFFICSVSAVIAWVAVQGLLAGHGYDATTTELIKWLSYAAAFRVCLLLSRRQLLRLLSFLAVVGVVIAVWGLLRAGSGDEIFTWSAVERHQGYVKGPFLNRNHCAGFLELVMGTQLGLILHAMLKGRLLRAVVWTSALVISAAALMRTGSRTGIACLGISLVCYSILLWRSSAEIRRKALWFLLCTSLAAIVGVVAGWKVLSFRIFELSDHLVSFEGRFSAWSEVIRMIQDHRWSGIGLGNFEWVYPGYQPGELIFTWHHALNDYLELAAELGIPAFMLLFSAFASLWFLCNRRLYRMQRSSHSVAWGAMVGVSALALHGLNDYNFAIPANVLIFMILFAASFRLLTSVTGGVTNGGPSTNHEVAASHN
ncbi:MAG: O-antigen ligase family protein [Candidatus Omnitrophota bacterium]|nr:O-antigen ligase family protein [Candidatus Omnitrophota bacterium]